MSTSFALGIQWPGMPIVYDLVHLWSEGAELLDAHCFTGTCCYLGRNEVRMEGQYIFNVFSCLACDSHCMGQQLVITQRRPL